MEVNDALTHWDAAARRWPPHISRRLTTKATKNTKKRP
jgi:hypothetical protein